MVAAEGRSAAALLRGAESVRLRCTSMRVELALNYKLPPPMANMDCLVEFDNDKRRFEVLTASSPFCGVVIVNANEVYAYRRQAHADVRLSDMGYVVGTSGDLAFDPRTLGLTDLLAADTTVQACIWHSNQEDLQVLNNETINNVQTWRVRAVTPTASSDYWIEEPSFRIHKRTVTWPQGHTIIESKFDVDDSKNPFPKLVQISRKDNNHNLERQITVNSIELDANIDGERFTLASMDLPINTTVVDYRIQRTIGFWDGSGLSEDPVYPNEDAKDMAGTRRTWLIIINVCVIAVILFIIWRRRAPVA